MPRRAMLEPRVKELRASWRASNPLVRLQHQMGLSRGLFGVWLGTDPVTLRMVEEGELASLPPRIRQALAEAGIEADAVAQQYVAWRQGYRNALRAALQTALPAKGGIEDGRPDPAAPDLG